MIIWGYIENNARNLPLSLLNILFKKKTGKKYSINVNIRCTKVLQASASNL